MARILGIDYGSKRVGIAVTDPLQIIATPLTTIPSHEVIQFLKDYFIKEKVECIVLGMATNTDNEDTHSSPLIRNFAKGLKKNFPEIELVFEDESFTSKRALQSMIESGTSKSKRREKGNLDKISATLILQSYMERKLNKI